MYMTSTYQTNTDILNLIGSSNYKNAMTKATNGRLFISKAILSMWYLPSVGSKCDSPKTTASLISINCLFFYTAVEATLENPDNVLA